MDSQWDSLTPFQPLVSKDSQLSVALLLVLAGFSLTGLFSINKSITTAPFLALLASLSLGFGSVFLICAVGVYV